MRRITDEINLGLSNGVMLVTRFRSARKAMYYKRKALLDTELNRTWGVNTGEVVDPTAES